MAITYIMGGAGTGADCSATNGGAFTTGGSVTYVNCQGANGGPVDTADDAVASDRGDGKMRLTKTGRFTNSIAGMYAYCTWSTYYTNGRYLILAVNADYIDIDTAYSNAATADINVGGALAGTGGNGVFTGCLETVDGLLASGDQLLIPNGSASQRTYTETNTCTIASASAGATINIIGVNNDGTPIVAVRDTPTNGLFPNGPLHEAQFPKIDFSGTPTKYMAVGSYNNLCSLSVKADRDSSAATVYGSSASSCTINDSIVNNIGAAESVYVSNYGLILNSDLICSDVSHTLYVARIGTYGEINSSRIVGSGSSDTDGGLFGTYLTKIIGNVFLDIGGGNAVNITSGSFLNSIHNNVFYDCITCIGTSNAAQTGQMVATNNIAINCTNFLVNGYAATAAQHLFIKNNVYYNVTNVITAADWYGISATAALGFIALTADPFVDAANGDFNLANTAETRSLLIGKSSNGTDIGALSHDPDYPDDGNVTEDDTVNGVTGKYHEAATAEVQDGVFFGDESALEGTYAGGGGGGLLQGNKRGNKQ